MRGIVVRVVVAVLMGAATVGAAPLNKFRAFVERGGTNSVAKYFERYGITNAAEVAAIAASWDEDAVIDVLLKKQAFTAIGGVLGAEKVSAANMERIKAALLADKAPSTYAADIGVRFPVAERGALKGVVAAACAKRYAEQPEFGRLWMKYVFQQGVSVYSSTASVEDLVSLLFAAEPLAISEAECLKRALKARVIELARAALRAEGKSFVVKDGVNPMLVRVQPAVDALNAPACEGLEAALRGVGVNVRDYERRELKKLGDAWRSQVMRGDVSSGQASHLLGKIAIVMGVDAYNRFVDEYNNGKAGAK